MVGSIIVIDWNDSTRFPQNDALVGKEVKVISDIQDSVNSFYKIVLQDIDGIEYVYETNSNKPAFSY